MNSEEILKLEVRLLCEGIRSVYGYDFSDYSEASFLRRCKLWLSNSGFSSFSEAQSRVLRDPVTFESLLHGITVNVTEMFRDPDFFMVLRQKIIPYLQTYPFIKIWLAGCSTGEEAYSMAILLHEAGMQGRYRIYATDINERVLQQAKDGIFPIWQMQSYSQSYQAAGGTACFSDYYTEAYGHTIFMPELKKDLIFSQHNLLIDAEPGEMNLILCRNVLIYFKPEMKDRCIALFNRALVSGGFLCLGSQESLSTRELFSLYEKFAPHRSIYRKKYANASTSELPCTRHYRSARRGVGA
ncbi:MAG: protein-glutamate O-methyltransferase CheR [Rhodoferax sp.]|nr:protein-glutamate O-methyltransferase CheR [Rhodoferax sp.]